MITPMVATRVRMVVCGMGRTTNATMMQTATEAMRMKVWSIVGSKKVGGLGEIEKCIHTPPTYPPIKTASRTDVLDRCL